MSRDHRVTPDVLARMSTRRFLALITGLSDQARFPRVWRSTPRRADSPEDIARITGIPAQ